MVNFFWASGGVLVGFVAWLVLIDYGWRVFVGLLAIPAVIAVIYSICAIPESPYFSAVTGNPEDAEKVLKKLAVTNNSPNFFEKHEIDMEQLRKAKTSSSERGNLLQLFKHGHAKTTVPLVAIWFSVTACYYGFVMASTTIVQLGNNKGHSNSNVSCSVSTCK